MRLEPIAYMTWAKAHVEDETIANLAASGIRFLVTEADLLDGLEKIPLFGINSDGLPALRAAVAARYGVAEERVMTSEGTSLANFLILCAWLRPGDRVLVEEPLYEPIESVLKSCEARIVRVAVDTGEGHAPLLARLESDRSTPFRAVVLTNPHNPTALTIPDSLFRRLAEACAAQGGIVFVDEAYREILLEDPPGCAARLHDRICVTASLTKAYGLSNLRIGWAIGPPDLIAKATRIHDNLGVVHPYVAEALGARLLADAAKMEELRARLRRRIETNRAALNAFFAGRSEFEGEAPPHGILAFPRWRGTAGIASADQLCERALAEAGVALVPGRFFDRPDRVRIGAGGREEDVQRYLDRFAAYLDEKGRSA